MKLLLIPLAVIFSFSCSHRNSGLEGKIRSFNAERVRSRCHAIPASFVCGNFLLFSLNWSSGIEMPKGRFYFSKSVEMDSGKTKIVSETDTYLYSSSEVYKDFEGNIGRRELVVKFKLINDKYVFSSAFTTKTDRGLKEMTEPEFEKELGGFVSAQPLTEPKTAAKSTPANDTQPTAGEDQKP